MNYKSIGEIGQNCVIGDLSRYGIVMAVPLSDNIPFDLIAIINNSNLFRIQVKTSSRYRNNVVKFALRTTNWRRGTTRTYTGTDCDVCVCYDLLNKNTFLLTKKDFLNRSHFSFRYKPPKNNNKNINKSDDFIISEKRIKEVFNFNPPDMGVFFSYYDNYPKYTIICQNCGKEKKTTYKNKKYCSQKCAHKQQERVQRPTKEMLIDLIKINPLVQIGKKFGVSDNAIRKWAKSYNINIKKVKSLVS